ncbi:hypothetical protein HYDPIDRAFT_41637 [Hydnomerulius pinastri MD-312]|uniref:Unplaced genomic scaffold scaffold_19, whole genome shotgun sequence n=1 Tax=Hydnomerulius pinastri MD-312 TaxID=994086 RepID=A0A0C9VXH8_9AGAM|nr:hypothetical protein HYDPIDRAFT_41637 [Hydnomerulius pinastri MD-312]
MFARLLASPEFQALIQGHQRPNIESQQNTENAQLDALVHEAASIQHDVDTSATRCASLERLLAGLQRRSERVLTHDASRAMDSLIALTSSIEWLYNVTEKQKAALVKRHDTHTSELAFKMRSSLSGHCKAQSKVVHNYFKWLHEKSTMLMEKYAELATDLTYEITLSEGRIRRLQDMLQVAEQLRRGAELQRQSWNEQKSTAEEHVRTAENTRRAAERKREDTESARVVRNIFTFGLGEVFDLFDLNEEIEDAERIIASTRRNVEQCGESIRVANEALMRIDGEVDRLNNLRATVHGQEFTLSGSIAHGEELRTRTMELTNKSLDVSLYVGRLAAKSEMLRFNLTAQEFARGVLDFGRIMVSERRVRGVLVDNPGALQGTLEMIAQSDAGEGVSQNGHVYGIDDMM